MNYSLIGKNWHNLEHKLTDDFWSGKIAAEGLGTIAALLKNGHELVLLPSTS